jgi:hypothetical protein
MRAEVTGDQMTEETHDARGHDDHADDAEALGPVDVQAWGAFLVGVAAGLVIVICLVMSTSSVG